MSAQEIKAYLTPFDYLERERAAESKSDYINGHIVAKTGGNFRHNRISGNISMRIGMAHKGRPCVDFTSDMKVRIEKANQFRYPDASALCGDIDFYDDTQDSITNPQFIAEVLSPSTETFDRKDKFAMYRLIDSFTEYMLVSQDVYYVEVFRKDQEGKWAGQSYSSLADQIELTSLDITLTLGDLYEKVEFAADSNT